MAIQALAGPVQALFGGSADLSESNLTTVKDAEPFEAGEADRNLWFGVREHAMGGVANGIAYHGGCPGTFLNFSDYMRGSVRLAALAGQLRHLRLDARFRRARRGRSDPPAGRALRGLRADAEPVVRSTRRRERGDGCTGLAVGRRDGPVALSLTRQKLPTLAGTAELARRASRGRGTSCARQAARTGAGRRTCS